MLKRDLPNDYCEKYFETYNKETFFNELQKGTNSDKLYLTKSQLDALNSESLKTTRFIQGTMVSSIIAFLAFNKLPVLGTIQNRSLKILLRLGLLVMPTYFVADSMIPQIATLKELAFQQQQQKYKDYLRSGDLLKINP